jgi:hypothetical protein
MAKKNPELIKFNERLNNLILAQDDFVEQYAKGLMKEDGKAHIEVDLCHGADVFDPFSNRHDLDPSLFAYVESSAKYLRVTVPVSIDFQIDPSKAADQERISKEFRGNYRFEFDETRHEIAKCNRAILWLYFVGIVLILITSLLTGFYHNFSDQGTSGAEYFDIASQITSIASWVFIWDAVDKQAFEKKDLKRKSLRSAQLCGADITFVTPTASSLVPSTPDGKGSL